jgi:hypothetical protein
LKDGSVSHEERLLETPLVAHETGVPLDKACDAAVLVELFTRLRTSASFDVAGTAKFSTATQCPASASNISDVSRFNDAGR